MLCLLGRNKVQNYTRWRAVFDSLGAEHKKAGLFLINVWRGDKEPDNVIFMFEVEDKDKAQAFLDNPETIKIETLSGVVEAEYHFFERQTHKRPNLGNLYA